MIRMTFIALLTPLLTLPAMAAAATTVTEAIDARTPFRAYLVQGMNILRERGALKIADASRPSDFDPAKFDPLHHKFSPPPPVGWNHPDFNDSCWARYQQDDLADSLGGYGATVQGATRSAWPTLLCLRTSFGVADPAKVTDLTVMAEYLGGVIVYVNGQEIGRSFIPPGETNWVTPAEDYPVDAYTTEDDRTALPALERDIEPDSPWLERYGKRIRTVSLSVPPRVLARGRNVLAIELHRAALAGPVHDRAWAHLGIRQVKLTSASGAGVIPYVQAAKGTHAWTADAVEQVTETPAAETLINKRRGRNILWARGVSFRGVRMGNPFDPPRPMRMGVPRNGVCSGQAVLSDLEGLRGVSAALADFKGPGGAIMPATAARIRYAVQQPGSHYCDALMDEPPDNAKSIPIWLILQTPRDQAPGWYSSTLTLQANGKRFAVPVQVLTTGLVLPNARDFSSHVGMTQSPETLAIHYGAEPWSEEHFKLQEKSLALLGQVGNDVLHVPVILGNALPAARDWVGDGGNRGSWRLPMIRWERTDAGLKPDFSVLERFLDLYARHCAPPEALCLYIWDSSCASEMADAYENRRIASKNYAPKRPVLVQAWDPKTKKAEDHEAPPITAPGAERFWKPMLDGVQQIVKRRGWSERCIMVGLGGDMRPGEKTGQLLRQWAPYARWNILSHFSGDPGPKDGKMIATGGLEVGLKEFPWLLVGAAQPVSFLEERISRPLDFLEITTNRWHHEEFSPPLTFRTMPLVTGDITRLGLDFWLSGKDKPKNISFFNAVSSLTVPGRDGAVPTVRFQMLREGVQDQEVRRILIRSYLKLPPEQQSIYRALADEVRLRVAWGSRYLGQQELGHDWPAYMARLQRAAAELDGIKDEASWERPPAAEWQQ